MYVQRKIIYCPRPISQGLRQDKENGRCLVMVWQSWLDLLGLLGVFSTASREKCLTPTIALVTWYEACCSRTSLQETKTPGWQGSGGIFIGFTGPQSNVSWINDQTYHWQQTSDCKYFLWFTYDVLPTGRFTAVNLSFWNIGKKVKLRIVIGDIGWQHEIALSHIVARHVQCLYVLVLTWPNFLHHVVQCEVLS